MRDALGLALALSLRSLPARAETPDDMGEKAVKAMEELATIVDKDKDKCDVMGADISSFADKNGELIAKGREMSKKATPEQQKAWREKYQARAAAAGEKMKPGMMNCYKNEKVKAAFVKMKMR